MIYVCKYFWLRVNAPGGGKSSGGVLFDQRVSSVLDKHGAFPYPTGEFALKG
jgi:hypothetical protein